MAQHQFSAFHYPFIILLFPLPLPLILALCLLAMVHNNSLHSQWMDSYTSLAQMGSSSVTKSPPSSSSPSSTESLNGLKFRQKIYFEDVGLGAPAKSGGRSALSSSGATLLKKSRGGANQGAQPPRCQVEGCKVDLSDAMTYYSRHKVCGMHSNRLGLL